MEDYTYRNFRIKIDKDRRWSYRNDEMGDIFRWRICHTGGWELERGSEDYESLSKCKEQAEQRVDKLLSGGW